MAGLESVPGMAILPQNRTTAGTWEDPNQGGDIQVSLSPIRNEIFDRMFFAQSVRNRSRTALRQGGRRERSGCSRHPDHGVNRSRSLARPGASDVAAGLYADQRREVAAGEEDIRLLFPGAR